MEKSFEQIESHIVDLATGEYVSEDQQLDPETFDQRAAAKDPEMSVKISPEKDLAGIGRRAKYSLVYLVKKDDKLAQVILPVDGKGLWGAIYGFLALEGDLSTVKGVTFYEHAETPGLGAEIENPSWKALWAGKKIYDEQGDLQFNIAKGAADQNNPHEIDGLSGATLTVNGVSAMVKYWMDDDGFKKLLEQMKAEGA